MGVASGSSRVRPMCDFSYDYHLSQGFAWSLQPSSGQSCKAQQGEIDGRNIEIPQLVPLRFNSKGLYP